MVEERCTHVLLEFCASKNVYIVPPALKNATFNVYFFSD